jgi:hypothetical protein
MPCAATRRTGPAGCFDFAHFTVHFFEAGVTRRWNEADFVRRYGLGNIGDAHMLWRLHLDLHQEDG